LEVRTALLEIVAELARWENTSNVPVIALAQRLTLVATKTFAPEKERPFVVDTFAGGGAIPVEAVRAGADVFASDINPLPILLIRLRLSTSQSTGAYLATKCAASERRWPSAYG
jgi:adenine-specific DNA methylase